MLAVTPYHKMRDSQAYVYTVGIPMVRPIEDSDTHAQTKQRRSDRAHLVDGSGYGAAFPVHCQVR